MKNSLSEIGLIYSFLTIMYTRTWLKAWNLWRACIRYCNTLSSVSI